MQNIEVIISPDGSSVTIEAHEFKGSACLEKTQELISSLGRVVDSGTTPDYYAHEAVSVGV